MKRFGQSRMLGGWGRVTAALGIIGMTLAVAGPAQAQFNPGPLPTVDETPEYGDPGSGPSVPNFSRMQFDFWRDGRACGRFSILFVDVVTGKFEADLTSLTQSGSGTARGRIVPVQNNGGYRITFAISSPWDTWSYDGYLVWQPNQWVMGGDAVYQEGSFIERHSWGASGGPPAPPVRIDR